MEHLVQEMRLSPVVEGARNIWQCDALIGPEPLTLIGRRHASGQRTLRQQLDDRL
jgi:hypothetical protein